jgi:2-(1,2-epoxy-1,2-dihydrophenyl)acetyl-CoA isomerase
MNPILLNIENNIATITLNRPDKFNSFTKEMALLLQSTLDDCAKDENIRAIVLIGAGKAFCAGQDLAEATSESFPGFTEVVSKHYNPIILKMQAMPKPIIVAVNGVAAGAGANIALAGDIVIAHENASFIQAFSKIGLVPDSGGTYFLPRLIGTQKAMALMMLGDKVSANEALDLGMIYKVFDAENFEKSVQELALKIAAMPTAALALTKKLIHQSTTNNLEQQLQAECTLQTEAGNTADYKEGVASFLEKRMPVFTGK